jgi:serine/threonine protein kinase
MILDIQDIINSVSVPALIKDEFIKRGTFARLKNGDLQACVGGFSIVFPVEVDGAKWAFRCWHHTLDNDQARIKLLSSELRKTGLPYFIDFVYEDRGVVVNGAVYPTTRMKWINGRDIKDYICYNRNNRHKLFELASNFFAMTQDLHHLSIAHGDLQHENIIVDPYGKIYLIDYDSMYVPALSYMNSKNSTNGKEGYQHPARENCVFSNPTLDYFSEVVILTSILAIAYNPTLIDKYDMEDSDTMLFKKADFRSFGSSNIYSDLSSMGDIFVVFLNVLSSYLKKRDITRIDPLELAVNKANPTNAISIADYLKNAENDLLKAEKEAEEARTKAEECKKAEEEARKQAAIKAEEDAWYEACRRDTIGHYEAYLKEFPDGFHADEARNCITRLRDDNRWAASCRKNTLEAYRLYQTDWPEGRHISECRQIIDELIWYAALNENTIESYENYIRNSTTGKYVGKARKKIRRLKWIKRAIKWFLAFAFFILAACTVNEYKEFFVQLKDTIISHLNIVPPPKEGGEKGDDNTTKGGIITIPENNESNQERIKEICEDLDRRLKVLEEAKPYLDFTKGEDFNPHAKEKVEELIRQLNRLDHAKAAKFQLRYDNLYKK